MLVFHAYIKEMHGSRAKYPVKNLGPQRCTEEIHSGVKGLDRMCMHLISSFTEQK
jgi:hypothetical protein